MWSNDKPNFVFLLHFNTNDKILAISGRPLEISPRAAGWTALHYVLRSHTVSKMLHYGPFGQAFV